MARYYKISGVGPVGAFFDPIESREQAIIVSDLVPGAWDITVIGYNTQDEPIGKGVSPISVIAGNTHSITISVEEIGGVGTFSFSIELPDQAPQITNVELDFIPEYGQMSSHTFSLEDHGDDLTVPQVDSGFYGLSVRLYNGNQIRWGRTYSVRIVKDQVTLGTIAPTEGEFATFSGIDLTIIDGMPVLFDVTLTSNKDVIGDGESITFTAEPNAEGDNYSYWWFVDGSRLEGKDGETLTLTDELDIGVHNVSVIAIRAGVMASASRSIVKNNDPVEMPEGETINGVYLYPEEIQQILSDLNLTELPTETGLLLLSPNAIQSPQSGEILPYSFDIKVFGPNETLWEVSLPRGIFSRFVSIDAEKFSNTDYWIEGVRIGNNSTQDEFYCSLVLSEEGPTILWLDAIDFSGNRRGYLENIESSGMRGLIRSPLPLTSTNGTTLTVSDFYTPDGYIESVKKEYWGDEYWYTILMKSNYVNVGDRKKFTIYTKPSVMADGKRSLGERIITSQYLNRLTVPSILGVQYRGLDGSIFTEGYYITNSQAFSLTLDEGFLFAGWENGTFFKELSVPTWPNGQEYPDTQTLPSPIVVADDTPIITACYFDRSNEQQGDAQFLVESPLITEILKITFSEPVRSRGDASITADNFEISGATITNITHNDDAIDVTVSNFESGPFSLAIIDLISADGSTSIEGQLQFNSNIVELIISNDDSCGSVSKHAGLYFAEENVNVTVYPSLNFRAPRLNDPYGHYYNNSVGKGEPTTFQVRLNRYKEDWTYTISPQYE